MIPSIFMVIEKLPLNPNGKIDRKNLPPPAFSNRSSTHLKDNIALSSPRNEIEDYNTLHIWCDIFQQNQISIDTNIFTIGGHSLLLMQLFHRYKIQFHLETNAILFRLQIFFNIQPLSIMLNSFVKLLATHKTSMMYLLVFIASHSR